MAYKSTPGTEDDETCLWQYGCRTIDYIKGDPIRNSYKRKNRQKEKNYHRVRRYKLIGDYGKDNNRN